MIWKRGFASMFKNFELMFECDGGVTISLLHGATLVYVNYYEDMERAAIDLRAFFGLEYAIDLWDDNMMNDDDFDPYFLQFNVDQERNGLAFWAMSIDDIKKSVQFLTWQNLQDFINHWGE
ncbi:MAG: hypothetical protein ACM3NJ_00535 [Methanobacterium sp.]